MLKRVGLLSLVLGSALAIIPMTAKAADWHDHDDHGRSHERYDRDRGHERHWRGGDRDWREDHDWHRRRDWDDRWRGRNYLYFNYTPAPRYYNPPRYYGPSYSNPYYSAPYDSYPSYNPYPNYNYPY